MPETKTFKKLKASMMREYLGEPVPSEYRKEYGKMYNRKDINIFAIKTARKRGIKIDE